MILWQRLRTLLPDRSGSTSIELALAMPILAGLLLTGVEVTRYVQLNQKTERASATIADLVSREDVITQDKLDDIFEITAESLTPFDVTSGIEVIVTSVVRDGSNAPTISWQRGWGPGTESSRIGSEGGEADLPDGVVVRAGENIIASEIFYDYSPVFSNDALVASTLYKRSVFRPRFGSLASIAGE